MIITQRLRERRDDLGLTQKQIVTRLAKCGLQTTNRALSSLEHGAGLDVAKLPELAIALDCTVTYLIGLTEDPHSWVPDPVAPPTAPPLAASPLPGRPAARTPAGRPARVRPPAPSESFILGTYIPDRAVGLRRPGPPR
jgi:transcriptional regulator with XRE-family HTH domain